MYKCVMDIGFVSFYYFSKQMFAEKKKKTTICENLTIFCNPDK